MIKSKGYPLYSDFINIEQFPTLQWSPRSQVTVSTEKHMGPWHASTETNEELQIHSTIYPCEKWIAYLRCRNATYALYTFGQCNQLTVEQKKHGGWRNSPAPRGPSGRFTSFKSPLQPTGHLHQFPSIDLEFGKLKKYDKLSLLMFKIVAVPPSRNIGWNHWQSRHFFGKPRLRRVCHWATS